MFDGIFEAIEEWMRELLTGMVTSNLSTMFTDVNEKTGEIATQVGQTPQGWNGSIFSLIQNLSNSVILSMIPPMNYENSVVSCGITVCATIMMPPPLISCFIPN